MTDESPRRSGREDIERFLTHEGRAKVAALMAETEAEGDDGFDMDAVVAQNLADHATVYDPAPEPAPHLPYCEGGHGVVVSCAQVAAWRRDSARDLWRCWHNPSSGGRSLHSFGDGDVCCHEGCGQ